MDISISNEEVVFKTAFSEKYDLLQFFRGLGLGTINANCPVDFKAAGIQRKGHIDIWHTDIPFAFTTDECTPQYVNGEYIGANHGMPCCVSVTSKNHDKDFSDIGSLWVDAKGVKWTFLKISDDILLFMSENFGTKTDYKFKDKIEGKLTFISHGEHTTDIELNSQYKDVLKRVNKYKKKEVIAISDFSRERVISSCTGCDEAEIIEEYDIINPSTVCDALRENRPKGGYKSPVDLAIGEPMLNCKLIYRILSEGTVLTDFTYTVLQDVNYELCHGIMYQEKCDPCGKGIYRYIPKLKPFTEEGEKFDFSTPYNTSDVPFPQNLHVSRDLWENPDSPPDRQIDFIRNYDDNNLVAFAGGYLPVFDGKPEIRKNNITHATYIYRTKKTYPTFANGEYIKKLHGVGYKKYFLNEHKKTSVYSISHDNSKYIYIDFFEYDTIKINTKGLQIEILEKSQDMNLDIGEEFIKLSASKGYAVIKHNKKSSL